MNCNQEAKYKLKNGQFCCSKSINSCPVKRAKDSATKKKNKGSIWWLQEGKTHPKKGKKSWNSGKSFSILGKQKAIIYKQKISNALKGKATGKASTPEKEQRRRQNISINGKGKIGGYRQGSGRGKKGWYKGFWCDSSYELAFVVYCVEHDIKLLRNTEKFSYIFNNEIKNWIPDFIVDGVYVEIKGYETEQTKAKFAAFSHPLKVYKEKDLKHIFEYVVAKYGKDYINLYE